MLNGGNAFKTTVFLACHAM